MSKYNNETDYKITGIQYNKDESNLSSKPYWYIHMNSVDPVNGTKTPMVIRTESDNDVLQTLVGNVIPDMKEDIAKLKKRIEVLESKKRRQSRK
jgi:hypothetical protein